MPDVLIVEDEEDILKLLAFTLEGPEFTLRLARSGEEGLAAAREKTPDLVLLDIGLPGMNGRDVCRALRSEPATRNVPVAFLTARGGADEIRQGLAAGADAYLLKPFDPYPLRETLVRLLAKTRPAA